MYEKRFVLFLDILGFQRIIEETEKNDEPQKEKIQDLISALDEMFQIVSIKHEKTSKIVSQFSDSIVVSFSADDQNEIQLFFGYIHKLIVKLVNRKILCRGAVAYGNIYHTEKFIFGPALVEAYLTESQAAIYPRIICDKSVIDIMKKSTVVDYTSYLSIRFDGKVEMYLKVDLDDKLYFDFFSTAAYQFDNNQLFEYYEKLRKIIMDGNRIKSPGLKGKYGWLKNKYNNIKIDFDKIDQEEELYYKRPDIETFTKKFKKI